MFKKALLILTVGITLGAQANPFDLGDNQCSKALKDCQLGVQSACDYFFTECND